MKDIKKHINVDYLANIEQVANEEPVVSVIPYDKTYKVELHKSESNSELILEYPTVYIIYDKSSSNKNERKYKVYVGETSDIERRTWEHLTIDSNRRNDWDDWSESKEAQMMVIGDRLFNKSLTLDIENRLILYLMGVNGITQVTNRRSNPQHKYFMSESADDIFAKVWDAMRKVQPEMLPKREEIEKSAIYKSSPFHALNQEQNEGKMQIFEKVEKTLREYDDTADEATVIFVTGQAGSGKTVLMSNLFYDLSKITLDPNDDIEDENADRVSVTLLVNQKEQLTVYKQIAQKLGLDSENPEVVTKPTSFINNHDTSNKIDVILVDEAHLLLTQGRMSYRGKNQLNDLLKLAKVVIVVFDRYQILTTQEYLDQEEVQAMEDKAKKMGNLIELKKQERMDAGRETIEWIHNVAVEQFIGRIPDDEHYQLKIARSPESLYQKIVNLDGSNGNENSNLVRLLATFDWKYGQKPNLEETTGYWMVETGALKLPWNLQKQKELSRNEKKKIKSLAWAEQPQTLGEVGSTYTIQGFDLNYAGVIIGPSVTYHNGKIEFVSENSMNGNATKKRTLNGEKIDVSKELLRNELNVLLTRGVHGLFIYAVDPDLQQALIEAASKGHILEE